MKIEVITMVYNEEFLIPFFLKHYGFADKIHILLDTDTTDQTLNKISEFSKFKPTTIVHPFKFPDKLSNNIRLDLIHSIYNQIVDGYVIVVDSDEFSFVSKDDLIDNKEIYFTKFWNVYRHKTEKDLDINLSV